MDNRSEIPGKIARVREWVEQQFVEAGQFYVEAEDWAGDSIYRWMLHRSDEHWLSRRASTTSQEHARGLTYPPT